MGRLRNKENVLWSFTPHDISVFQYLLSSFPCDVSSVGSKFLQKNIHDIVITHLKYPNGAEGHIHTSWLNPFKEHKLVVIGSKGSIVFEDNEEMHLLLYKRGDFLESKPPILKNKAIKKIKYNNELPLENELKYFLDIVNGKSVKIGNIDDGIDVVSILEIASKSLKN